jgi:hypothetical protein
MVLVGLLPLGLGLTGCATTAVYERARLADSAMTGSSNGALEFLRAKVEAAREAGLGRSTSAGAGGCGCE